MNLLLAVGYRSEVSFDAADVRSLLFVPGDSASKLAKAKGLVADALVFDWEDAVLASGKAAAREITRTALAEREAYPQAIVIRVNSVRSGSLDEDLDALARCPADAVMFPKCEGEHHLGLLSARTGLPVIATIETPLGVVRAAESASYSGQVAALMFGAEDYSTEMGIVRTGSEPETLFARSATVNAARAFGKEAYDSPCMDYRDADTMRETTERGRRMGYSGRLAIHPNQPPVINEIYTASESEVEAARKMLKEFDSTGLGVVGMEGQVIDEPVIERARRVVRAAERRAR